MIMALSRSSQPLIDLCAPASCDALFSLLRKKGLNVLFIRLDFPEPLTHVTQVKRPRGTSTSTSLRL